jgi:hypothetical protein
MPSAFGPWIAMPSCAVSASVTGFQRIQKRHRRGRDADGERFGLAFRQFGKGALPERLEAESEERAV